MRSVAIYRNEFKQWFLLFIIAFLLNVLWENMHSVLYVHYKGAPITQLVLLRASLVDAFYILLLGGIAKVRGGVWTMVVGGAVIAIGIEWWALEAGRWAYENTMPIIPFLNTGLTPTVQLALAGAASYSMIFHKRAV